MVVIGGGAHWMLGSFILVDLIERGRKHGVSAPIVQAEFVSLTIYQGVCQREGCRQLTPGKLTALSLAATAAHAFRDEMSPAWVPRQKQNGSATFLTFRLANMRQRVRQPDGTLTSTASPGHGIHCKRQCPVPYCWALKLTS